LKTTPIMVDIMEMTLEAFDARTGTPAEGTAPVLSAPPAAKPEVHGEIGHLLVHAGLSEPYLQGYLTALAISPLTPTARTWLGPLLGQAEFPSEGDLERLLELIMMRANRISEEAADPKTVTRWIAALDETSLRDWTAGFDDLVAAAKAAWPNKALAADDKRVLKDIGAVADGGESGSLRTILPLWVATRHTKRR
jgi:yecA family protein